MTITQSLLALGVLILALMPLVFTGKFRLTDTRSNASPIDEAMSDEQYLRYKINNIVIPLVNFDNTTIEEALDFIKLRARELDPAEKESQRDLGFIFIKPSVKDTTIQPLRVNTQGKNLTLGQVLDSMCQEAKLQWKIAGDTIVLEPLD